MRLVIFFIIAGFFYSCSLFNNETGSQLKYSYAVINGDTIYYEVVGKGQYPNAVLHTSDNTALEIKAISEAIYHQESLSNFLLFRNIEAYKSYYSSYIKASSDTGYLGKYDNNIFFPSSPEVLQD